MTTFFYGQNLCNILSNLIIENFNLIDSNHITSIKITNNGQFFVITGNTTIKNPVNYSTIFKEYIEDKTKNEISFKVIDLISYNTNNNENYVYLKKTYTSKNLYTPLNFKDVEYDGFISVDNEIQKIFSNNKSLYDFYIQKNNIQNYEFIKSIDSFPFVSDSLFGKNLSLSKIYDIYFRYISYNIFNSNICQDISFTFFSNEDVENISWENLELIISSDTLITSTEWLKSLILDIFDFKPKFIIKHLGLSDYNFESEILSNKKCWMKNDKIKDIILL